MAVGLADLPPEMILRILFFLPELDILILQRTSSSFCQLISGTATLQYRIAKELAGYEDNPCASERHVSVLERLHALRKLESSLINVSPSFSMSIPVTFRPCGLYELSAGRYMLGTTSRTRIKALTLPSTPTDEPRWHDVDVGFHIIDFGLSICENDLLAAVVLCVSFNANAVDPAPQIGISLIQYSTGLPHPEAKDAYIPVSSLRGGWFPPYLSIEIIGDSLVLILHYTPANGPSPSDEFYVYNWRKGTRRLGIEALHGTYSSFCFLTENMVFLPNKDNETFEYWSLEPETPVCIGALQLPTLRPEVRIFLLSCRGEPNPMRAGAWSHSPDLFAPRPETAILILNFHFVSMRGDHGSHALSLVVHRNSLMDLVPRLSPDTTLAWTEWGPPICRWFAMDNINTRWITTTAGQRLICVPESNDEDSDAAVCICDFNPYNVRRFRHGSLFPGVHDMSRDIFTLVDEPETLEAQDRIDVFEEPVTSELPYLCSRSATLHKFDGVLLDDRRIIGLKVCTHLLSVRLLTRRQSNGLDSHVHYLEVMCFA
ncbi:hypothetical protein FISHEDRAFT_40809 [Fistulina hepatica ATCC 64428]|uniref:F-box domain-containing protein n=1 Tax=Fistulina hepatica ATCC 64428 TaxID=1128425 RepID=A0A0D7AEK4_9AGAR|nr:hypothetical protein FISHEDRAFT_40809 [Fistulina hepatica ATCC 64428]